MKKAAMNSEGRQGRRNGVWVLRFVLWIRIFCLVFWINIPPAPVRYFVCRFRILFIFRTFKNYNFVFSCPFVGFYFFNVI